MNKKLGVADMFFQKALVSALVAAVLLVSNICGQAVKDPAVPKRGLAAGASTGISDIENINLTNGNLMMNLPLVSLAHGRGGLSASLGLTYNSKLYDSSVEELPNLSNVPSMQNMLVDNVTPGWRTVNSLDYEIRVVNRLAGGDNIPCEPTSGFQKKSYKWKVLLVTPDGGEKVLRPVGYNDLYNDGFFDVSPSGVRSLNGISSVGGGNYACNYNEQQVPTPLVYYTTDGSYIRYTNGVLYFSDGSRLQNNRLTDRYGNYIESGSFSFNGSTVNGLIDQFGRKIFTTAGDAPNETFYYQIGFGGAPLKWKVRTRAVYVRKQYETSSAGLSLERGGTSFQYVVMTFENMVDEIVLPDEMGGQSYKFDYNGSETDLIGTTETSVGWGELSSVVLPSGAKAEYQYKWDAGILTPDIDDVLTNSVKNKTLTYDEKYDNQTTPRTEIWNYAIGNTGSSVASPDGSSMSQSHGNIKTNNVYNGIVFQAESSTGTKTEKLWEFNRPMGEGGTVAPTNPFVKAEFTSTKDLSNAYVWTAIKEFWQDKNGNQTLVKEYDYVPYSSVPRDEFGKIIALPANLKPTRVIETKYYNPTPDSSDNSDATYGYWKYVGIKNVVASVEVSKVLPNGNLEPVSRTEFAYDNFSTTANVTEVKTWDSSKAAYSNPLTSTNSVSTKVLSYDQYGNPTLTRDANGVETTVTYGCINGEASPCSTSVEGLYPTRTESASNFPSLKRTSTATYDLNTGLVTKATDVDNNVSVITEHDPLGRPTKVRNAADTPLESWTRSEYNDVLRRVIVRSDLETVGDGKRIAIQHYDQLGRVRLSRSIENAATEDPTDEKHGIKVQTRYLSGNPISYQLTSNPYRADYSYNAGSEETMGWTLSRSWNTGTKQQVETFSGSALPAPWGSNGTSTGLITTERDADRTLVTDQAGKQRISRTNAFGQLKDVWEVTGSDPNTEAIAFGNPVVNLHGYKTGYAYDILNNLTTVNQGSQTRSFTYSSLSRLLTATNPESGAIGYGYDSNGNLTKKTDARGVQTDYVYDALNRVTNRNYSTPGGTPANYQASPNVTYTYDNVTNAKGKLTKVLTGSGTNSSTTEYTGFDILGRVMAHKQTTDGMDYTTGYAYNLSGAMVEQTYPSGRKVLNVLDAAGSLATVKSRKNASTGYWAYANNFTYNASGAVTSMQLGNGTWESTTFNSRLQPEQIALGTANTGAQAYDKLKLNYTYGTTNNNGNVVTQTITVPTVGTHTGFAATQTYTYDSLNRLEDATEMLTPNGGSASRSWEQTFSFDRYGNRNFDEANTTTLPKNCGTSPNFTVCTPDRKVVNPTISPSNNRIVLDQDGDSTNDYAFDTSGNTTKDADSRTFVYDAENKQVEVKNSASQTIGQYFYDGDGRRVKKFVPSTGETTIFVYDAAGKLVAEYSTVVADTNNAKVAYLTSDHLGSPRINTDKNGNVTARHDFQPFGEEIATGQRTAGIGYIDDTVRKQFTGYEREKETDLDFAQARYYAENFGRFNSPDPLLTSGRIHVPQSWNKYSYVLGNPLKYSDPLGLYEYAEGTSEDDKKRIKKAYDKLVAARDKFKEGTKKYNEINRSITTLGKPGEANGVFIYVNNNQATPGKTDGSPTFGSDYKATGKAENWIGINLTNSSNATSEGLAGTLGHEGRHAADNVSEAVNLKGLSFLQYNERKDSGQIMSHAITEVNAYRISSYIAEAISPSNVAYVSVNGAEIWNRSWNAVDHDANRDKGIIGVLESPNGSYKFKFTPDPKSANNSIDNPVLWTTNGGPIF